MDRALPPGSAPLGSAGDGRAGGSALVGAVVRAARRATASAGAATEALLVGPLLLGVAKPVHVMVPSVTARGIVNMTALAVAQAAAATP